MTRGHQYNTLSQPSIKARYTILEEKNDFFITKVVANFFINKEQPNFYGGEWGGGGVENNQIRTNISSMGLKQ